MFENGPSLYEQFLFMGARRIPIQEQGFLEPAQQCTVSTTDASPMLPQLLQNQESFVSMMDQQQQRPVMNNFI